MDFQNVGTVADHAYWLGAEASQLRRHRPLGRVDARSEGFGLRDPADNPTQTQPGTLQGGNLGPLAYVRAVELGAGAGRQAPVTSSTWMPRTLPCG